MKLKTELMAKKKVSNLKSDDFAGGMRVFSYLY